VQTVALRIICERELEIEAFVPVEYWSLDARLAAGAPPEFTARLVSWKGGKLKFDGGDPRLSGEAAETVRGAIASASWTVAQVEKTERRKSSPPPFITSQLQQAAARRLGFRSAARCRSPSGSLKARSFRSGTVGLITYMRTDSTRTSDDAPRRCAS
jgi:DNA topoisomerase-1